METRKIILGAFAICFALVALSGCKNKKQSANTAVEPVAVVSDVAEPAVVVATDNPDTPAEAARVIEYRRTPCFGTCPIFNFKVYENGVAMYEGKNFVDMIGTYMSKVSDKQIAEIISVAKSIHFFEMKEVYDNQSVTDLPSVYISVVNGSNGLKQVKSRYQGPKELKTLTEKLDALIKELEWSLVSSEIKD